MAGVGIIVVALVLTCVQLVNVFGDKPTDPVFYVRYGVYALLVVIGVGWIAKGVRRKRPTGDDEPGTA
jgi:hypothetical protein